MSWAERMLEAHQSGSTFPSASTDQPGLGLADAYVLQKSYVDLRTGGGDAIAGFKAALTAPPAQQALGIDTAIAGVLFEPGARTTGAPLSVRSGALLETELGFRLNTDVQAPVDAAQASKCIGQMVLMIEIARPNLAGRPNGVDLVAANAASHEFIAGPAFEPAAWAPDALALTLEHNGQVVLSGRAGEVMDCQTHALAWLINQALHVGYTPRAGHLLMTGSVGGMHPAKPGRYRATFGGAGTIDFEIQAG